MLLCAETSVPACILRIIICHFVLLLLPSIFGIIHSCVSYMSACMTDGSVLCMSISSLYAYVYQLTLACTLACDRIQAAQYD